jgi:hypothetical protein
MNIGLVVDGDAEYAAFSPVLAQLRSETRHAFLNPLKADIQPLAPAGAVAERCMKPSKQLRLRGADMVVVLIDRERRSECPGEWAASIMEHLNLGYVHVIIKNQMFENWLIADIDALECQRGRFSVSQATRRAVQPNKADNVDAMQLIKRSVIRGGYQKVVDAKRILEHADHRRMALHSRSFRRLLRAVQHPEYRRQSRRPQS